MRQTVSNACHDSAHLDCGLHAPDGMACACECHTDESHPQYNRDYVHVTVPQGETPETAQDEREDETMPESAAIVVHDFSDMGCYADNDGVCYARIDGSVNWPDWDGVDTCTCGAALPDVCDGVCPDCGQAYWVLVSPACDECGKPIHHDSEYWLCLDGGETYCLDCVTIA